MNLTSLFKGILTLFLAILCVIFPRILEERLFCWLMLADVCVFESFGYTVPLASLKRGKKASFVLYGRVQFCRNLISPIRFVTTTGPSSVSPCHFRDLLVTLRLSVLPVTTFINREPLCRRLRGWLSVSDNRGWIFSDYVVDKVYDTHASSFFKLKVQLTYSLVPISAVQQWPSHTYMNIGSLSHVIFHPGPSQEIGHSSLCCTVGPRCLSILIF